MKPPQLGGFAVSILNTMTATVESPFRPVTECTRDTRDRHKFYNNIRADYYQALADKDDPKLAWWAAFKQYYLPDLRLDEWTDQLWLNGAVVTQAQLLTQFEQWLGRMCPVGEPTIRRWFACDTPASPYNPVKSYLEALQPLRPMDDAEWAGLAARYLGVSDDLSAELLTTWLIASVRRALKPGCWQKRALVVRGDQEAGKTPFFRILASERWFYRMSASVSEADLARNLRYSWIVEMGEIEAITRKKDVEALKGLLDEKSDKLVEKYRTDQSVYPRHCIFAGTANSRSIFNDPTGSKRFGVIDLPRGWRVPLEELEAGERDRIWHAAYTRFKGGASHHLTDDMIARSEARNRAFEGDEYEKLALTELVDHLKATVAADFDGVALQASHIAVHLLGYRMPVGSRTYAKIGAQLEQMGFTQGYVSQRKRWISPGAEKPLAIPEATLIQAMRSLP